MSWGHQFLTEVKKNLDSGIFQLGLSNFWIGAWFPFDAFQFIFHRSKQTTMILNFLSLSTFAHESADIKSAYFQSAVSSAKVQILKIPNHGGPFILINGK